ncbi:MAG: regulatory protein TetR [Marmoricola sp.]|nr:regulatory protein TetR [Marmoricola sp.]
MVRWEPDAEGRLRVAALELYTERGFEQTTVADIAERAGVTARTFFRYFADKREVLFAGSSVLQDLMVTGLKDAPAGASPLTAIAAALDAAATMFGPERRTFSRQRHAVITANAELRERELIKMESLGAALAAGLRRRGVPDPRAGLAAQAGLAVFHVGFQNWVAGGDEDFADLMRAGMADLRGLAAEA